MSLITIFVTLCFSQWNFSVFSLMFRLHSYVRRNICGFAWERHVKTIASLSHRPIILDYYGLSDFHTIELLTL